MTRPLLFLFAMACTGAVATDVTPDTDSDTDVADTEVAAAFAFSTPAWADGDTVPDVYTCAGAGGWSAQHNPELVWSDAPEGTAAFVMIFDDPDAGGYPHWAFFTDDASLGGIAEAVSNTASLPAGVTELESGDRRIGYIPNCPGGNLHAYRWRLWAVDTADLGVDADSSFDALEEAARGASLERVTFTGMSDANDR